MFIRNNKGKLDSLFNDYMKVYLSTEEVNEKLIILKEQLQEIKTEVSANLKLFSKDIINEEQYKSQNDELQESKKSIEYEINRLTKIDDEREFAKKQYNNYIKFLNEIDLDNITNILLRRIVNKIEAVTFTDNSGKEVKKLFFVWNILDKNMDDLLYKSINM